MQDKRDNHRHYRSALIGDNGVHGDGDNVHEAKKMRSPWRRRQLKATLHVCMY